MVKNFENFVTEGHYPSAEKSVKIYTKTDYSFDDLLEALQYMKEWVQEYPDDTYPNWGEFTHGNEDFVEDLMAGSADATVELVDWIYELYFKQKGEN